MTVYYGLFNSIISYGIIAWGSAYSNVFDQIFNLQNRVLKLIASSKKYNSSSKILNIKQSYILNSLLLNYENLKKDYNDSMAVTRAKNI